MGLRKDVYIIISNFSDDWLKIFKFVWFRECCFGFKMVINFCKEVEN